MAIHVMLDLETMGVGMSPAITEIAAVSFDPYSDESNGDVFHTGVSLVSSILLGLDIDQSTIDFWRNQSDEAKQATIRSQENSRRLKGALYDLFFFLDVAKQQSGQDDIRIWGNGVLSDNLWIMSACKRVGITFEDHIRHWQHSDFRTLMEVCEATTGFNPKKQLKNDGVLHNPVDDCRYQIKCVQAAFDKIKNT